MEILLALTVGALNVVCFFIGAKVGQKVSKGEDIKLPIPDPVEFRRKREEKKHAEKEQERMNIIMRNLDNYDGTGRNQKDVPR